MEKINKKVTKYCNICYLNGIAEGKKQEQKKIRDIIESPKELLQMALDDEKENQRPNLLMTYYRILKQQIYNQEINSGSMAQSSLFIPEKSPDARKGRYRKAFEKAFKEKKL